MFAMNQQTLPLPNPDDWLTKGRVARQLGVSRRTVDRMVDRGALTAYSPVGAYKEKVPAMFWHADVLRVLDARLRLSGARR
jgi:excisionase family DNA binding protein